MGAEDTTAGQSGDDWASPTDLFQLDVWMARHAHDEPEPDPGPAPVPPRLPEGVVLWSRPECTEVHDAAHLAQLLEALRGHAFGTALGSSAPQARSGQVVRVSEADEPPTFIVEVHDGTPQDFARRVFRGLRPTDYPLSPEGDRPLHDAELFDSQHAAAILWSFLHDGLPPGYARTLRHLSPTELRRFGFNKEGTGKARPRR
ncbi:hypothetical protein [Agrococcus sp. KRD186]|uniref:hypothetical protein n=1 Tax=Agrococcus sp. KRD186 TaxID=2729730 RepID=UPI0019D21A07|nr:hypothetical protein [Agrococcus sp. KRD186]